MPRTTPSSPTYKTHTCHGDLYAYTRVDGRRISLGRAGTPEALTKYRRILSEWEAAHAERELAEPSRLTVSELAERFVEHQTRRIKKSEIHPKNGPFRSKSARSWRNTGRFLVAVGSVSAGTRWRPENEKAAAMLRQRLSLTSRCRAYSVGSIRRDPHSGQMTADPRT